MYLKTFQNIVYFIWMFYYLTCMHEVLILIIFIPILISCLYNIICQPSECSVTVFLFNGTDKGVQIEPDSLLRTT